LSGPVGKDLELHLPLRNTPEKFCTTDVMNLVENTFGYLLLFVDEMDTSYKLAAGYFLVTVVVNCTHFIGSPLNISQTTA